MKYEFIKFKERLDRLESFSTMEGIDVSGVIEDLTEILIKYELLQVSAGALFGCLSHCCPQSEIKYFYNLFEVSPSGVYKAGETYSKKEAEDWVNDGLSRGLNRCWHERNYERSL